MSVEKSHIFTPISLNGMTYLSSNICNLSLTISVICVPNNVYSAWLITGNQNSVLFGGQVFRGRRRRYRHVEDLCVSVQAEDLGAVSSIDAAAGRAVQCDAMSAYPGSWGEETGSRAESLSGLDLV